MSQYPVIRIPGEIQRVQEAMPPVPSSFIDPKVPHPGKEPQALNQGLMTLAGSAVGILSFVVAFSNAFWSLSLLLMGAAAIALSIWKQWQSFPERHSQWERQAREYEFWKVERPKRLRQYELMVQEAHKPERVIEYRKKQLKLVLSRTLPHDGTGSNATRGYSENEFFRHLSRYFPQKIYTGLILKIPNYPYPYTADFAYIDFQTSLHIDVEIDEPYVYNSEESTHFVGSKTDEKRDRFFLGRGWLVIRESRRTSVSLA